MRFKDYNKVELIYQASLDLIHREGIAGLTMSGLADKAGMATGTLYIYFASKEELLHKLYLSLRARSQERFMKDYDEKEPFKIGLKKVWINYLKHRIENHRESVFLEQYYHSPYITPEERDMAEAMKSPVHDLIRRGKREMLIKRNVDDEMVFLAMLGFIRELADESVSGVYILDNQRIEQAFQLSWDMIKA